MGKIYGLKAITMGDPAADGGMGTALTEVFGATVKGTATLTSTEPTSEEVEIEETDELYDEIQTKAGSWSLKASTYNISAETMRKLFGGTVAGTAPNQTWSAPVGGVSVAVHQSVSAETRGGAKFNFVKMKLTATANISFDKAKLGQIDWTGKVLTPDKAGTPAMSIVFGPTV